MTIEHCVYTSIAPSNIGGTMAKHTPMYNFDRWAEYLTVTLAENCARCHLGSNRVKKIHINVSASTPYPPSYKVILDNELIAQCNGHKKANSDASYPIDYYYQSPSGISPKSFQLDPVANTFVKRATDLDNAFYVDGWSLKQPGSIPFLLMHMALRSVTKLLPKQLKHQGVELSEDFTVQFYDGQNYLSFFYDSLKQDLANQVAMYMTDKRIKTHASGVCFKHLENRHWFMEL